MSKAVVYFTRDLSKNGLLKAYDKIKETLSGKLAVKLHTGEKNGPNILPRSWVKNLFETRLNNATIVETNTLYDGDRYTTKDHLETIKVNGWDFANVDILDSEGVSNLKVNGGVHFKEISVGSHILNYDSLLVLTHFKGHIKGGFGGSCKNIGIGIADGRIGKKMIHSSTNEVKYDIEKEGLMERIVESTKGTIDHFKNHIAYINCLRNMSVDCDCMGLKAAKVVTPNVGILSSLDILAIDKCSVDLVFAMKEKSQQLQERILSRHGLRQITYMKELNMGSDDYVILDLDNNCKEITPEECVKDVKPFREDNEK